MLQTSCRQSILTKSLALAVVAMGTSSAPAATITMTRSNSSFGESWNTVSVGGNFTWSDHLAAHAGTVGDPADYVVGTGFTVRTPISGSNSFPGDSLTLDAGQLNLNSANGTTTTINNLALTNGGNVVNATVGSTQTLAGSLSVGTGQTGIVRTGGTGGNARHINITAAVAGGGTLNLLQGGNVALANTASTFSGTWSIGGTNGSFSSTSGNETLVSAAIGALGNDASVEVNAYGKLDADYNWATAGALTINTNGQLILDQSLTVAALTVLGNAYGPGTYSFATLNGDHDAAFADGGSGSITVVPEPAAVSLLIAGGLLSMGRRRVVR